MNILPKALEDLISSLGSLPGVGQRSAERFAYHLFKSDSIKSEKIIKSLERLHKDIKYCPVTFALIDTSEKMSPLYTSSKRDKKLIAVVEDSFDIVALERTAQYSGTYHVLGGLLSPIDGISPESLHIDELLDRVSTDEVEEVILALSSSVEGESTSHYISNQLTEHGCKVTRLARGLPIGLDLEYADQITLGNALEGRKAI